MKWNGWFLIIALIQLVLVSFNADAAPKSTNMDNCDASLQIEGAVTLHDGTVLNGTISERIAKFSVGERQIELPYSSMKSIYDYHKDSSTVTIVNAADTVINARKAHWVQLSVYLIYYDAVAMSKLCMYIEPMDFVSVEFGESTGTVKYNTRTETFFPAHFMFDPYTGERLSLGNVKEVGE